MTHPIALFCRSRRLATAVALLVLVSVAAAVTSGQLVRVGQGADRSVPAALLLLPAVAGAVLAATAHSPLHGWDALGSARLPRTRFAQAAALTALAAAGALLALPDEILDGRGDLSAARNVIALCGVGLLGAVALGAAAAWLPPLLFSGLALTLGAEPDVAWLWTWLLAEDDGLGATVTALLFWGAGAMVYAGRGGRPTRGQVG
ncbi:hypothetical protein ACFVIM_05505 [Streptomyces sp. NPDC057638]|uniref:hypothetical protein n=1 Tax=Streptomyces sp. NPDC057638 TaxID=3346190 RepID=UPI0036801118